MGTAGSQRAQAITGSTRNNGSPQTDSGCILMGREYSRHKSDMEGHG